MSSLTDRYSSFYDPFAEGNVVQASDTFPNVKDLCMLHVDAPPPYSTLKRVLKVVSAREVTVPSKDSNSEVTRYDDFPLTYNARINLNIHGQGTVVANCTAPTCLLFTFSTAHRAQPSLYVQITESAVDFSYGPAVPESSTGYLPPGRTVISGKVVHAPADGEEEGAVCNYAKGSAATFLRPGMPYPARYWISVDHKNGILRFGRDFANLALTLYQAHLKEKTEKGVWRWRREEYKFIDDLVAVDVQQRGGNLKAGPLQLVYQPLPVVAKNPPVIVPSETITLDQLSMASATVPANLTAECQRLYANVAGAHVALDTPDFPEFSAAIERSVNTKGLLCQRLLEGKAEGKDYRSTYLRITLGVDLGNSPGAPYVLEIWPAMHASPIHNHGSAHAVIKVLHGRIKAYYFTSLFDAHPVGPPLRLQAGDVTWLDPENYQVHQLSNENRDGSVCCTIQCYSYGATDTRHYEAFDYVDEQTHDVIKQFEPNSDMRFDDFKTQLKQEWAQR